MSKASQVNPVIALLATLAIKGRAPKTGYDRALFGPAWTDNVSVDSGHNGCDTRNDILRRDLTKITIKPGSNGCTVITGVLHDVYTGKTIDFTRGQATSSAVQIDHIVALSDAWQKGAQQLSPDQRKNLANDPLNLQAVDGPTNARKSDGDAATWLPPNKSYRCTYVSRQVQVKARYQLWVTSAEKAAIERVLATCGAQISTANSVPPQTTAHAAPLTTTTQKTAPTTQAAPTTTHQAPTTTTHKAAPTTTKKAPTTTKKAPTRTTPQTKPPAASPGACHPKSPAGNCYKAGQFCAAAHHGVTGTDASGRTIKCKQDGSRWRWL